MEFLILERPVMMDALFRLLAAVLKTIATAVILIVLKQPVVMVLFALLLRLVRNASLLAPLFVLAV
jgi:hypothetical protein